MFQFYTDKAVRLVATKRPQRHRFGGVPIHKFVGKPSKSLHVHCLYLLDMDDPAVPRLLPNVKWLPLYYPLFNNACEFAYQVKSDEIVNVLNVSRKAESDFPYEDYPQILPEWHVKPTPLSYDEAKTLVFAFTMNSDGGGEVSEADRKLVKEMGYPFTQIGGVQWMLQGPPWNACQNKKCDYSRHESTHQIFAVVWNNPVPGFQVWGEDMDYCQLIHQICTNCQTIHVSNRCD